MEQPVQSAPANPAQDSVGNVLKHIARFFFLAVFGVLPIIFIPIAYAPFEYTKTFIVLIGVVLASIFFSLAVLRAGTLRLTLPRALGAFAVVALLNVIAASLSGDRYTSFIGDSFSVQSALFVVLMAFVMLVTPMIVESKLVVMRLYILLMGSALVLGLFQIARLIIGPKLLSLGVLGGATSNLLGGFNDLGLFFGLVILLSLVSLEQISLTKWGRILFSGVVGISLIMLAVVNFFAVWLVLGLVSLVVLMYSLTKDRFAAHSDAPSVSRSKAKPTVSAALVSAVVFIVSVLFIIGGSVTGAAISNLTGISYVEVHPSAAATLDVAKSVYRHNAFLGVGPNQFVRAWQMYRDPALNQTIFWSTDFSTGSGYLPTQFVTVGVLGVLAWIAFLGLLFWNGFRILFSAVAADRLWYFIATSSFVAAAYLWLMSAIYNPGAVIMLLAALFTGILFTAEAHLHSVRTVNLSALASRRAGFVLVGVVMLIIVGSVSTLYYAGRHYAAVYTFSGAVSGLDGSKDIKAVEQKMAQAFSLVPSDTYARQLALYQLAKLNSLLNVQKPTQAQQQTFNTAAVNGINAASKAISANPNNPANYSTRGAILSVLAATGVKGASTTAMEAFSSAQKLDPANPTYLLLEAQLLSRIGDTAGARDKITAAIKQKPNYTDALALLSQLDIAEGKVSDAISVTRSMISLEPNNPARLYQLGILLASDKQLDGAVSAFEQAVALNPNYANARYFLALGYLEQGNKDKALTELEAVAKLNPDNKQLTQTIADVKAGKQVPTLTDSINNTTAVQNESVKTNADGSVTTTEAPNTPLVSSVNPVAGDQTDTNATSSKSAETATTTSNQ